MKILIAGDRGQVGHELSRLYALTNHQMVYYNRTSLDVCDFKQVKDVLTLERPDVVINVTAYTAVDLAEDCADECFAVNADAPGSIAAACEQVGGICVQLSSDYVFNGNSYSPYVEVDPVSPIGVYGESKLAGENAVARACSRHIILRASWVFGSNGNNFLKTMIRLAQKRNIIGSIKIYCFKVVILSIWVIVD